MSADLRELNGVDTTTADGVTLGGKPPNGAPEGPPIPAPPPFRPGEKPPATKRSKAPAKQAQAWVRRLPLRYQLVAGAVGVVACTVIGVRMFVHPVDENAIAQDAAERAYAAISAELNQAKAESTQIAVPSALSWAPCPLSTEARVMIGGDVATGGKTLNPARAGVLDTQARALLQSFTIADLRLTAPSQSELRIVADNPSAGVAMFDCLPGNVAPATTVTTVAAG